MNWNRKRGFVLLILILLAVVVAIQVAPGGIGLVLSSSEPHKRAAETNLADQDAPLTPNEPGEANQAAALSASSAPNELDKSPVGSAATNAAISGDLPAPTGLAARKVTQTTIELTWESAHDNRQVTGYRLYRHVMANRFRSYWVVELDNVSAPPASVFDLEPGSSHKYAVAALDIEGNESEKSPVLEIRLLTPPVIYPPVYRGTTSVQAIVGHPFKHQLYTDGNPRPTLTLIEGPAGMKLDPVSGLLQWTPAEDDDGTATVTVRAANSEGSREETFSFLVHPAGADLEPPDMVRPPSVANITTSGVTLTWQPATDNVGVAGYYIRAQQSGRGNSLRLVGQTAGPATSYTLNNLKPNTGYRIWVAAYDSAGNVGLISGVPPSYITTLAADIVEPADSN